MTGGGARPWIELALLAAVVLVVGSGLARWIAADRFVDREEAQHVARALETERAVFGRPSELAPRLGQPKPWYGWPSYAVAAAIGGLGVRLEAAWLNLLYLVVAAAAVYRMASRVGPRAAGPLAALFLVATPGVIFWVRLTNPALLVVALTALAALALLATDGFRRPGRAFAAGLLAGLLGLAKISAVVYWLPVAGFVALDGILARRWVPWRGLAVFAAGLALPCVWFVTIAYPVLRTISERGGTVWEEPSVGNALAAVVTRFYEVFLALHLLLAAAALAWLVRRGSFRLLALGLAWLLVPVAGIVAATGHGGTGRDYLPLAVPLALLFGVAAATAPAWARRGAAVAVAVWAAAFVAVDLFGAGVPGLHPAAPAAGWLRPTVDGSHQVVRREPWPDVAALLAAELETRLPAGGGPCGCLPAAPYPVANAPHGRTVLFDHSQIGYENLLLHYHRRGSLPPWNMGLVPYPLSCSAFRTAVACSAAVVLDGEGRGADYPGDADVFPRRLELAQAAGPVATAGPVSYRLVLPSDPGICPLERRDEVPEAVRRRLLECGADGADFYAPFLALLSTSPGSYPPEEARRTLDAVAERRRALAAGADPAAVVFGEVLLAEWVEAAIEAGRRRTAEEVGDRSLPAEAFRARWESVRFPATVSAGASAPLAVAVRNAGPVPWPDRTAAGGPVSAVRLAWTWLDETGRPIGLEGRAELPAVVAPGETVEIAAAAAAPAAPGRYRLRLDLVQELVAFFADRGSAQPPVVEVDVVR